MLKRIFQKKTIEKSFAELNDAEGVKLKRVLSVRDLTLFGIASVIGAGIFSTIGQAAYVGGPSIVFLFIMTAATCGLASLSYAEFAARVPTAGSAYTYSYIVFGEIAAWIIGCCLVLEYIVSNIVVAISWSAYFENLLEGVGIHLPQWLLHSPFDGASIADAPVFFGMPISINLPTLFIIIPSTILCYIGMNETRKGSNLMVYFKLLIMFMVIVVGAVYIDPENWSPIFPNGIKGMFGGVSAVFFAYIGFDAISTTAEECKDPQRDLPRGIIYSLIICTILYILVALVITGAVNYSHFKNVADPIAFLFAQKNNTYMIYITSVGTVIAVTTALIIYQIGQPRIWMIMSRDGLLPRKFARVHPKFKTPSFGTILCGFIVGCGSLVLPIELVTEITSIGTLFAFAFVCFGILCLPKQSPSEKKTFSTPYINGRYVMPFLAAIYFYTNGKDAANMIMSFQDGFIVTIFFITALVVCVILSVKKQLSLIPVLGGLSCIYLMTEITVKSWIIFGYWIAAGLIVYFMYGYRKSKLRKAHAAELARASL